MKNKIKDTLQNRWLKWLPESLRVTMCSPGEMYGCITTGAFHPFASEVGRGFEKRMLLRMKNGTVMNDSKNNRTKWLHIRLTEVEYKKLQIGFSSSTKRKMSDYARSILLDKPITVYTRNRSYDDFVAEMILLRSELKAIGNNLNQSVKKLHAMDTDAEIKAWAILNENSRQNIFKKVDEINLKIAQLSDKWSQE